MKLLVSPASPYSAKCRMAARHLALGVEEVRVDTNAEPPELIDNNPLGKIPVLLRDGQKPVYDSVAIMQFFNRQSGGKLYPAEAQAELTRKCWKHWRMVLRIACSPSSTNAGSGPRIRSSSRGSTSSGAR